MRADLRKTVHHAVLLAACVPFAPAWAQTAVPSPAATPPAAPAGSGLDDLPPPEEAQPAPDIAPVQITVLATGARLAVDRSGQPISVLTAEDLNRIQGTDFTRVLQQVPGVTFANNGGQGAFTGIHLRGADSEQVLFLIDGVRVEDVSAPGAGFDFGTLTPGGIDRLEVLRGANSVVWGSAAIGGVISVTTRQTNGVVASVEGGSRGTFSGNFDAGVKKDRYAYAIDAGYTTTSGISAAASGTEPDGYHQWRIGGRGRVSLTDALSLQATARYTVGKTDIDGYPAPTYTIFADTDEFQRTYQFSGRLGAHYEKGVLTLDGGYALSSTRRLVFDPSTTPDLEYGYRGTSERADLTGSIKLPSDFILNFGGDNEWTRFSSTYDSEAHARLSSGHVLFGWVGPVASLSAAIRVDDHSQFGTHTTFGANGSVKVTSAIRLRASYGEGFKAPTLFQFYSTYGNRALVPETAKSYDAGIEYTSPDGRLRLGATIYRRDSSNLINYVSCYGVTDGICTDRPYGTYANVGSARADGVELEAFYTPTQKWRISALYSYDRAVNRTPGDANEGNALARRPRNVLTTSVDWTSPLAGLVVGADVRLQSSSWDDAANTMRLGAGELTTLRASLPFGNFLDVYARVENLFNDHHPTAAGYGTIGRGAFGGIRVRY
ncbi:TonB-dependent receptor [Novosphingobium nitrogenifigens DSM 19370]|uniref:TonB-dependent receptor n=1 Tax=Novosphingobium nitrogenifigens DSM 19370 TaxID=983920 RepID=F1ZBG1_9SPHN|nr:TonB-dependent receptor [Novosphingobium nitrogenifigens]EGD58141.1 TonB-dependent receptor [Novosphingobium nitrogenifigens DSM 19370]